MRSHWNMCCLAWTEGPPWSIWCLSVAERAVRGGGTWGTVFADICKWENINTCTNKQLMGKGISHLPYTMENHFTTSNITSMHQTKHHPPHPYTIHHQTLHHTKPSQMKRLVPQCNTSPVALLKEYYLSITYSNFNNKLFTLIHTSTSLMCNPYSIILRWGML